MMMNTNTTTTAATNVSAINRVHDPYAFSVVDTVSDTSSDAGLSSNNSTTKVTTADSNSTSSSSADPKLFCRDFLAGKCKRSNCKFVHPTADKMPLATEVCKDWLHGRCTRPRCRHFHGILDLLQYLHFQRAHCLSDDTPVTTVPLPMCPEGESCPHITDIAHQVRFVHPCSAAQTCPLSHSSVLHAHLFHHSYNPALPAPQQGSNAAQQQPAPCNCGCQQHAATVHYNTVAHVAAAPAALPPAPPQTVAYPPLPADTPLPPRATMGWPTY